MIKIFFNTNLGKNIVLRVVDDTPINNLLNNFNKLYGLSENDSKEILFIFNESKIDFHSKLTLKEYGIDNNSIINVIDTKNSIKKQELIEIHKIKKNNCIIHNEKLTSHCNQCNMEICDKCLKEHHKNHTTKILVSENDQIKKDLDEFENLIINSENNKINILKKIKRNITWFENDKNENEDLKEKIDNEIKNMLTKFYKYLEIGQNLIALSKILFLSYIKMKAGDDKINLYKDIINIINKYFSDEKIIAFDLNVFQISNKFNDKNICVLYKRSFDFIPKIKLKFNSVEKIDKEIIDSLYKNIKELFKEKNVNIIEIKKGSLSVILALNYLIQEKLEKMNIDDKNLDNILEELNEYLKIEAKNIKNTLKENLFIFQKDKKYKPDFAEESLYDLQIKSSKDELMKCIKSSKNNKYNSNNIFEISKEISPEEIKNFFNKLSEETKDIQNTLINKFNEVNNELEKYLEIFDNQFEEALKKSIFEYSTKNVVYIFRHDKNYISGQLRCNNIENKILFHGTNSYCISRIFGSEFNNSTMAIFGPGIYFSDSLDYTWYYSSDSGGKSSRENFNKIPHIGDSFSFITVNAYYDKDKFEQVFGTYKKNESVPEFGIRYILVDYESAAIPKDKLDKYYKFKGTEYLISNRNQILPLLSITVERIKYLMVWRDNNFDINNPNKYNQYEKILEFNNKIKNFASINLKAKIYYFNETEEALNFIKLKKYNKIILITNGGNDGENFIKKARKIIGNNTIALITCFMAKDYLKIVEKMENVFISSLHCNCIKKFLSLSCNEDLNELKNLQKECEKRYQKMDKSFKFKELDENAFKFPKFKESGKFEELDFEDIYEDHCIII